MKRTEGGMEGRGERDLYFPIRNCRVKLFTSKVKVLVAQSCPTLCSPMNYIPPGSSVRGILQVRILEWVAMSFSRGSPQPGIESGFP